MSTRPELEEPPFEGEESTDLTGAHHLWMLAIAVVPIAAATIWYLHH
ncbi:MAG TPA: hypothetical protein VGC45_12170 [Gryllotalpicola sp.]